MAHSLHVLSAGAAKAVVLQVGTDFERVADASLQASFGAVGAMRDKWAAGAPCDVLILSARLLEEMTAENAIDITTRRSLGRVRTGIAVRAGSPQPQIGDATQLKRALSGASALYLPDPERATAGIHCVEVLRRLGIFEALQPRLRPFPNGAIAMSELAASGDAHAIGCTQVTEILYTPGVVLVGALPPGLELNTEYAAAVTTRAADPALALDFIERLAGEPSAALRRAGGFEP